MGIEKNFEDWKGAEAWCLYLLAIEVHADYPVLPVSEDGKKDVFYVHGFDTPDAKVIERVNNLNKNDQKPENIIIHRLAWESVAARLKEYTGVGDLSRVLYPVDAEGTKVGSQTPVIDKQMREFLKSGQPFNFI